MIDVAVVGCGFMGRNHVHAVSDHPLLDLASVVDVDADVAAEVAEKYGAGEATTDFEDAVADADAVVVATPEFVHAEQAATVLDYDRHLLVEKPLTVDTDRAWDLAERAGATDAVTGVSFVLRYDPGYAGVREAVAEGEVGDPVAARAKRAVTVSESRRIGERGHPLYYMNIHDIDAMCWCVDSEVDSVDAVERRGELADVDVPDAMHATLTFADGTVGTVTGYGILPDETPGGIVSEFELLGTAGTTTVEAPSSAFDVTTADGYDRPDVRYWPTVHGRMDGAVGRQMDAFARAIDGDGDLLASVRDGAYAQTVADAIREAVDAPGSVSVDY